MRQVLSIWRRSNSLNRSIVLAFAVACMLFLIGGTLSPGFTVWSNVTRILVLSSFLGIAAGGETIVILTGGIDLSVPALMTGGALLSSNLIANNAHPLWLALAIALGSMAVAGAVNGLGVVYVGIPPMVMTLGMNTLLLGAELIYEYGQPFGSASPVVSRIVRGGWGPVSSDLLLWMGISIVLIIVMSRSVFGKRVYAVGTDILTSYYSGVNIQSSIISVYAISGLMAGMAGILLSGYTGYADMNMASAYQLETIAAVVIGGASILGGRGHYLGTIAGAIIITVLTSILLVVNISEGIRDIIYGLIILGALLLYGRERATQ